MAFRLRSPWLDVLAIAAWGALFLKYWVTGKLFLLIHPNYMGLTVAAGLVMLGLAGVRAGSLLKQHLQATPAQGDHLTLFPPGWASLLLLATAMLGLIVSPQAFASQTAVQRGVTDATTLTRVKPQAFRASNKSEDKSIVDWIRTLSSYPEPDAYTGQKVRVTGFVIHPDNLSEQYLFISRFILTCCAADAYPVSLPVKLSNHRSLYKPDTWLQVEGQMITETLNDKRQLVVQATALKPIAQPKNPYDD